MDIQKAFKEALTLYRPDKAINKALKERVSRNKKFDDRVYESSYS